MTEIEKYAVELVHEGARSAAEDDMDEDGAFETEADWRQACDYGLAMARAIRENPEEFLSWSRSVSVTGDE